MDPWHRFDTWYDQADKVGALNSILAELDESDAWLEDDRLELRAAVLATLAGLREIPLPEAVAAVRLAQEAGRPGWPNYHLADWALQLGFPDVARSALDAIPTGYFDAQDLHWRAVHCINMAAQCAVATGDLDGAEKQITLLVTEFFEVPDDDIYVSPHKLSEELVKHPEGTRLLRLLFARLNLDDWIVGELADEVRHRLGQPAT